MFQDNGLGRPLRLRDMLLSPVMLKQVQHDEGVLERSRFCTTFILPHRGRIEKPLKQLLNILLDAFRLVGRGVAADDFAVLVDEELSKIPLDRLGTEQAGLG